MTDEKWMYQVTLETGVSIGPPRYVRVVAVDGPNPWAAIVKAMKEIGSASVCTQTPSSPQSLGPATR